MRSKISVLVLCGLGVLGGADKALANRACCLPDGSCIGVRTIEDARELCYPFGGVTQASGVTCADNPCGGVCGDGVVDDSEQCDDGNMDDTDACRNNCTLPGCGDGVVGPGEECDDGNDVNEDGCRNDCTLPLCGDGSLDPNEECDDGNDNDDDGCRNNCTVPRCGDGVEDADEECDDGNTVDGDGCSSTCQQEELDGNGCTPGYWKQKHHLDSWVVYSPDDLYDDVFGVASGLGKTLHDALRTGGGGVNALLRHSTAALLNSSSAGVGFFYSSSEVIAIVQDAFDTGEFEAAKNLLAAQNEKGCPLN